MLNAEQERSKELNKKDTEIEKNCKIDFELKFSKIFNCLNGLEKVNFNKNDTL